MSRVAFHRPARFLPPTLPTDKVVLPAPPQAQASGTATLWMSMLMPLLGSMGMAAYMIVIGHALLMIIGIVFVVISLGTSITMWTQTRSANRRASTRQRRRYASHLTTVRGHARQVAAMQRVHAVLAHPEPSRLWGLVTAYERVWERRRSDPDFLRVSVGTGYAELATPMQVGNRLDPMAEYDWDSLVAAQRLVERLGRVSGQPSVVDLGGAGVVSLFGPRTLTEAAARAILCQVAVLHAADDVGIAIEMSGEGSWEWAKWLPHAIEPDAQSAAGITPLVAAGPEDLADYLTRDIARRQEALASRRLQIGADRAAAPAQRRLIVVFTGFEPVSEWGRSDLLRSLIESAGAQNGLTLVFLAEHETDEPSRVDLRIRLTAPDGVRVEGHGGLAGPPTESTVAVLMTVGHAELIARRLAPLRLSDEREQVLARLVSLSEMLLGGDPLAADFAALWSRRSEDKLLRVPLGSDGDGQPVVLDIKESAQGGSGPHGLIVGATGSGKSELLRTLVIGLSLTHSPELISFVLVDFKGGAAFAPLTELPHVAGLITNLADDAAMIDRVQAALQGEQQRRQQMLRRAGDLDSIRHYQQRVAAGTPGADGNPLPPMPYLLIIVDEFGELLSGRPDFTDLFVQIGRVGRSLGMHLVLATQRLEEGRLRGLDSHLSYRICLRTFSAAESRTVIGTADAYRLPAIPGSAYLKVDESIYQRFRVAHVSEQYVSTQDRQAAQRVRVDVVPFGLRQPAAGEPTDDQAPPSAENGPTELTVMVDRLKMIGRPVHQVWLPPLPSVIPMDSLFGSASVQPGRGLVARDWPLLGQLKIPIGVVDQPALQQQRPLIMDFAGAHGNLALVGAPQSGRSTALRTIMLAGMLTHTPEEVQFYCVDFGGGSLHPYATAPHVGTVVGRSDLALTRRTFAEIRSLIVSREGLFRQLAVDSITDFRGRRAAGQLPPGLRAADVFLLIDNWGAVRGELEDADAAVAEIAARGLGVGIHLVLTASRWVEIRPALRDSIGTRIELRLNDPTESEIARRLAARLKSAVPGRAVVAPGAFVHLLLPRMDGRESADGVGDAQDDMLTKVAAAWTGAPAPPVRLLPERVRADALALLPPPGGVPVGIGEADLGSVGVDLTGEDQHLLIFGDAGSGKTTFLRTWITGLVASQSAWQARLVIFDYRRSLLGLVPADHLGAYAPDGTTAAAYVDQVCAKLRERLPPPDITPQELRARRWWEGPEIYVVLDDYELTGGAPGQPSAVAKLAEFIPHARDVGLHVVLTRRVAGGGRISFGDQLMMRLKETGCGGLVLSGDPREGPMIGEVKAAVRAPGRGVLVRRGVPDLLIQVAITEDADESSASAAGRH